MYQLFIYLSLFFCCIGFTTFAQTKIDSLEKELAIHPTADSLRADILNLLALQYLYEKPENTVKYGLEALEISRKIGDKKREGYSLNKIGAGYLSKGDLSQALSSYKESQEVAKQINDVELASRNMGNIGLIYLNTENYPMALSYYQQSLAGAKQLNNEMRIAMNLNNIGVLYQNTKNYDSALYYFQKAIPFAQQHTPTTLCFIYANLGEIYFTQKKFEIAKDYYINKCLPLAQELGDDSAILSCYLYLAEENLRTQQIAKASEYAQKALNIAQNSGIKEDIVKTYEVLSKIAVAQQKFENALNYKNLAITYEDSIKNETNKNALQIFEYEYKKGEIAQLKAQQLEKEAVFQAQNARNRLFLSLAGVLLVSVSVITLYILRSRKKISIAYEQLAVANDEISEKNKNIIASINYAKRIQSALLPPTETISQYFADFFLFYQPKDIVSGDFYWHSQVMHGDKYKEHFTFVAVADCTGHGVPGAFMTVIGKILLEQLIYVDKIVEPATILFTLDQRLSQMLQQYAQDSHKIQDGMDIALMRFNLAKQELVWAGAKRPLWHYHAQTQQLTEHKSNVYPIGGLENIKKTFTQTVLTLQTNDIFYTFTDGFTDQFGEKGKFGTKKLRNILPSITNLPLLQQAQILQNHLKTWQGTTKQTDDILFVGLKI